MLVEDGNVSKISSSCGISLRKFLVEAITCTDYCQFIGQNSWAAQQDCFHCFRNFQSVSHLIIFHFRQLCFSFSGRLELKAFILRHILKILKAKFFPELCAFLPDGCQLRSHLKRCCRKMFTFGSF